MSLNSGAQPRRSAFGAATTAATRAGTNPNAAVYTPLSAPPFVPRNDATFPGVAPNSASPTSPPPAGSTLITTPTTKGAPNQHPWSFGLAWEASRDSIRFARFDPCYESLWTVDSYCTATTYTLPERDLSQPQTYSYFRAVKDMSAPVAFSFVGPNTAYGRSSSGGGGYAAVCATATSLWGYKLGGCPAFTIPIAAPFQRKVAHMSCGKDEVVVAGETPGLTRVRVGRPYDFIDYKALWDHTQSAIKAGSAFSAPEVISGCPPDNERQQIWQPIDLPQSVVETLGSTSVANTAVSALAPTFNADASGVESLMPIGLSGGVVVFADSSNDFKIVGGTKKAAASVVKIGHLRTSGNYVLATLNAMGSCTMKLFDMRNYTNEVCTFVSNCGAAEDVQLFKNPYTDIPEVFFLGKRRISFFRCGSKEAVHSTKDIDKGSFTSCAVSENRLSAVATTSTGHLTMFTRNAPLYGGALLLEDEVVPPTQGADGEGAAATQPFPHEVDALPNIIKPELLEMASKGSLFKSAAAPITAAPRVPPKGDGSWLQQERGEGAGFDEKVPAEELFSAWPPDDYMILSVPERSFIPGVIEKAFQNQRNHHGRVENTFGVTREVAFRSNPKDKLSKVIPNPYPFNTKVGDDPACAAEQLVVLKKELKLKEAKFRPGKLSQCGKLHEALQLCFPVTGPPFEWSRFNAVPHKFVGLDNSLSESWVTSILQCLYHVHEPHYPVRRALIRHFCRRPDCLACEVSIVFSNMLTAAKNRGSTPLAQVSSLLSTLKRRQEFMDEGVFVPPANRDEMVAKLHRAQILILKCLNTDLLSLTDDDRLDDLTEGIADYRRFISKYFGTDIGGDTVTLAPLLYIPVPASATLVDQGLAHILKELEGAGVGEKLRINHLPPILVLVMNPEHGTLEPPPSLKFSRKTDSFSYTLRCCVIHITDDEDDVGNLVTQIRGIDGITTLINDYLIFNIDNETSAFGLSAHSYAIAYYSQEGMALSPEYDETVEHKVPNTISFSSPLFIKDSLLVKDAGSQPRDLEELQGNLNDIAKRHVNNNAPLVAFDAEYVVPRWGNPRPEAYTMEYAAQQRRSHFLLARVSLLLSTHESDERLLLDDYVATDEEIADYVSLYSGIHEGDLSVETSSYMLTTAKAVYLKMRALVDAGVMFVGHGLQQDFRVCNIQVPPSQIIDTLDLFTNDTGKKMALKVLATHFLGESVQEGEHDSIEDARTALRLYRKYQELTASGEFEEAINSVISGRGLPSHLVKGSQARAPLSSVGDTSPARTVSGTPTPASLQQPRRQENDVITPPTMTTAATNNNNPDSPAPKPSAFPTRPSAFGAAIMKSAAASGTPSPSTLTQQGSHQD